MNSCLFECRVMHHRFTPTVHHFRHRLFLFALDLDELDEVAARVTLFSRGRRNLFAFHDRDHLTLPGLEHATAKENVLTWIAREGAALPADTRSLRVTLVTLPRVLGYVFNPVSFYFVHDAGGAPLCAVAEVGNTFGEQKPFLLDAPAADGMFRLQTTKHFYVSPFSAPDLTFEFTLRAPADRLSLRVDVRDGSALVLASGVAGRRAPLTDTTLAWFAIKYPPLTLKVTALIHAHAALLWLKRTPWHRKAAQTELQRRVLRPHASLTGTAR